MFVRIVVPLDGCGFRCRAQPRFSARSRAAGNESRAAFV